MHRPAVNFGKQSIILLAAVNIGGLVPICVFLTLAKLWVCSITFKEVKISSFLLFLSKLKYYQRMYRGKESGIVSLRIFSNAHPQPSTWAG